jgi:hypothetical protein
MMHSSMAALGDTRAAAPASANVITDWGANAETIMQGSVPARHLRNTWSSQHGPEPHRLLDHLRDAALALFGNREKFRGHHGIP